MIGHRDVQGYLLLYPIMFRNVKLKPGLDWCVCLVGLTVVLGVHGTWSHFRDPCLFTFLIGRAECRRKVNLWLLWLFSCKQDFQKYTQTY